MEVKHRTPEGVLANTLSHSTDCRYVTNILGDKHSKDFVNLPHKPCPVCGSAKTAHRGSMYVCHACGNKWDVML